ncbi:prophage antirepressor [Alkaliphilus metalliredigens QYMF]|uniref:Prophage antirepressor n=1 Tax=Alkaliphilus metalliredigens (strain QYMF) TaxID=293826 RepID=A6TLJ8_ALKMQ|nr:phage antirepressor [Alkaliphilus metalliredigens]ABR47066.1 prophage antirepressor [Alkaliphilus metalliredigens QYMF]
MNKQLQVFEKEEFGQVRVLRQDGQPWFVGKDIADSLGYKNPSDALLKHVDEEDKALAKCDTLGGTQQMTIINESGLYGLILSSKLPNAKRFKRWVTSEVLPSIQRHGVYMTPDKIEEVLLNPDMIIGLATKLKVEQELSKKQQQIIGELKPKADYMDKILKNKGLVTITQIAKDYGMSGQAMNDLLHSLRVQYKQSGQWLLYRAHHGRGYTHSETIDILRSDGNLDIKMNTKWTQKGRLFLYDLLREHNILPTIEKAPLAATNRGIEKQFIVSISI